MTEPRRPAALICAAPGSGPDAMTRERQAVTEAARQRGWPAPAVYADEEPGPAGPALRRLEAAIVAGRHDALILGCGGVASGGGPVPLMKLLFACTKNGVRVELLPPVPPPPGLSPGERRGVLARARLDALAGLFPEWRIWVDGHGWHARRRDGVYLQEYRHGAPAFSVHAACAVSLAAQLSWQQAAEPGSARRTVRGRAAS